MKKLVMGFCCFLNFTYSYYFLSYFCACENVNTCLSYRVTLDVIGLSHFYFHAISITPET